MAFILQHGFDGVDIDWEYPVVGGYPANIRRSADKTNFTLLRQKLDTQAERDGKDYLLTIAGGADITYTWNTELNLIGSYVDYATVMTYDIHGPWDVYTDLNAPLYTPDETSPHDQWSVDQAVGAWIAQGFPASKLVLGVPFYGYAYHGVSGGGNGLYQRYTGGASVSYDRVLSAYLTDGSYLKYRHADAVVPWLFHGTTFVSFEDERSVSEKAAYISQHNLAGASVWELSQNRGGQLLSALVSRLN